MYFWFLTLRHFVAGGDEESDEESKAKKKEEEDEELRKKKEEEEKVLEMKKQQDRARPVSSTPVPGECPAPFVKCEMRRVVENGLKRTKHLSKHSPTTAQVLRLAASIYLWRQQQC